MLDLDLDLMVVEQEALLVVLQVVLMPQVMVLEEEEVLIRATEVQVVTELLL